MKMIQGLPSLITGSALLAYGVGTQLDPTIEYAILSVLTGTKSKIGRIVINFEPFITPAATKYDVPWQYVVGIISKETGSYIQQNGSVNWPGGSLHPEDWVTIEPAFKSVYPSGSDYHLYSSFGPMQVSWTTAGHDKKYVTSWQQLLDFGTNIDCGTHILSDKYDAYGNWDDAVMAYNGPVGSAATQAYLKGVSTAVYALNQMIQNGDIYYG